MRDFIAIFVLVFCGWWCGYRHAVNKVLDVWPAPIVDGISEHYICYPRPVTGADIWPPYRLNLAGAPDEPQ